MSVRYKRLNHKTRSHQSDVTCHLFIGGWGTNTGHTTARLQADLMEAGCNIENLMHIEIGPGYAFVSFTSVDSAAHAKTMLALAEKPPVVQFCDRQTLGSAELESCNKNKEHNIVPLDLGATGTAEMVAAKYCTRLGIRYVDNIVSNEEANWFLDKFNAGVWEHCLKRRVQHFGFPFNYHALTVDKPHELQNSTLPAYFQPLIDRLLAQKILLQAPNQITVNEYPPGVGIGMHIDTHSAFEGGICTVSLAATCAMEFQRVPGPREVVSNVSAARTTGERFNADRFSILLRKNSVCCFNGESRFAYKHGIASRKTDSVDGKVNKREKRISITMRKVRVDFTCACPWPHCCDSQQPDTLRKPTRLRLKTSSP